jgi:hypothetical protein
MDGWDVVLLVAAGYVALSALVRLMLRRRNQMFDELRQQVGRGQRKQSKENNPRRKKTA